MNTTTEITEIVMPGIVEPSGLQTRTRAMPVPGPGQALVRIDATGVSFAEQSMRRGRYPSKPKFPFVPGYDFVGTVQAVAADVTEPAIGTRVAAVTKIGGWATHTLVDARRLVPVPAELDPALIETVIVNGVTAWQMLFDKAHAKRGQTILVHGANGGVGNVLSQLAIHARIRVIGTAAPRHHEALRSIGVEPVDYNDPDLVARVRELAPGGVDAAFDHLGLASAHVSFGLLARGGTLVSYGFAAALDDDNALAPAFMKLLSRLTLWNMLPNTRHAGFYNFWAGSKIRPTRFRRQLHDALTSVVGLVAQGAIAPQIAARFPLTDAIAAMELAESRTAHGKVVILP